MNVLNDNKAGMQGLDKQRINAVIAQATGARYKAHVDKKQQRLQQRIDAQRAALDKLTPGQMKHHKQQMDSLCAWLDSVRSLHRLCVHVDMDAFYAAVECRDEPKLRHVPMAVGSTSMLSTSNYAARKFGVRAAMPGFVALKLCPQLTIVPTNFDKYNAASDKVREILRDYDPELSMHMDEAYMDLTAVVQQRAELDQPVSHPRTSYGGECECWLPRATEAQSQQPPSQQDVCPKCSRSRALYTEQVQFGHSAEQIVSEMRFRVEQHTGLTCSAGIAPNHLLAKIASDRNKPNGQCVVPSNAAAATEFIRQLSVRKVSGIGGVLEAQLNALHIYTCADVYEKRAVVAALFSELTTNFLMRVCMGVGSSDGEAPAAEGETDSGRKSISVERTFADESDPAKLTVICERLCEQLAELMQQKQLFGSTVTIKLKTVAFDQLTRAHTVGRPVHTAAQLYALALKLLNTELDKDKALALRLFGVRVSNLRAPDASSPPRNSRSLMQYFGRVEEDDESSNDCPAAGPSTSTASVAPQPQTADNDENNCDDASAAEQQQQPLQSTAVEAKADVFSCPVCQHRLPVLRTETQRVRHIDECLSRQSVSELINEQNTQLQPAVASGSGSGSKSKRKQSTAANSNGNSKRSRTQPVCMKMDSFVHKLQ